MLCTFHTVFSFHVKGPMYCIGPFRVLVIGRICKGLKECCPSLHALVRGLESSSDVSVERKRFRLPSSSSNSVSVWFVC